MTADEVNKVARLFVKDAYGNSIPQEHSFNIAIDSFKEGYNLAEKHWQEKTAWIPFPSRKMPELYKDYIVKYDLLGKECIDIMTFRNTERLGQRFIKIVDMGLGDGIVSYPVTHWKEIE